MRWKSKLNIEKGIKKELLSGAAKLGWGLALWWLSNRRSERSEANTGLGSEGGEREGEEGEGDEEGEEVRFILDRCRERGLTLAVAESCTGGLLGAKISEVVGASDVFLGGVITYQNEIKIGALGVSAEDIKMAGPVSRVVAKQMALGVREKLNASIGVSITGIAGPGDVDGLTVGTVWVGINSDRNNRGDIETEGTGPEETESQGGREAREQLFLFQGNRREVREQAAQAALNMIKVMFLDKSVR